MDKELRSILQNAIYAAIYVVLCYVFQAFSFQAIQVRIAEALCVLAIFDKRAAISISIGCFLSNILFSGIIDAVFGTLATFIGLYAIRYIKSNNFFIKMLPTVISNALIIPFVVKFAFGDNMPLLLIGVTVAIGEFISVCIVGYLLYLSLKKLDIWNRY